MVWYVNTNPAPRRPPITILRGARIRLSLATFLAVHASNSHMAGFADIDLDPGTVRGLKRGDKSALAEIYTLLAPVIMGMAQRILQDRSLAQEVVQDTFVQLIEQRGGLRTPQAVTAWLRKVAVNHCLMRLRSPWLGKRASEAPVEAADRLQSRERLEGLADIERALAMLSPESRLVIWLHDVEGYTHREIARLMGRKTSYSKSRHARGYQKLLGRFGESDAREDAGERADAVRAACPS